MLYNISTIKENTYILTDNFKLNGLSATYTEQEEEAATLIITLYDPIIQTEMILYYTIFTEINAIARSVRFVNLGTQKIKLKRALSMSLDLYDSDFEMIQLDGAWGRERHITKRPLFNGVQSISSARGASSHHHNPFILDSRKRDESASL